MKTVLIVLGSLFLLFLVVLILCACRATSIADEREEAMFSNWYATHTEENEEGC